MLCSASAASGALLIRDPPARAALWVVALSESVGPGSAVHRFALHRARDTFPMPECFGPNCQVSRDETR